MELSGFHSIWRRAKIKKRCIGLSDNLYSYHIYVEQRKAFLDLIDEGIQNGLPQFKVCESLQIDECRVQRWCKDAASGIYNRKTRTTNQKSYKSLTPAEVLGGATQAITNQSIKLYSLDDLLK